jgi:hypothetical protein
MHIQHTIVGLMHIHSISGFKTHIQHTRMGLLHTPVADRMDPKVIASCQDQLTRPPAALRARRG